MISRFLKQTAVYWGGPVNNGTGGYNFDDPIEINVRWEDKQEVLEDDQGNELISRAVVYTNQQLEEQGYLYLGRLDDMESASSPSDITGSRRIVQIGSIPSLDASQTLYTYYLK